VEPGAAGRPELLPNLRLDELLAEHGRLQAVIQTGDRMRGLLEAVVAIGSGLALESALRRIAETAVGLVDATYGALGVIGDGKRLAEFIPVGLTQDEIARILTTSWSSRRKTAIGSAASSAGPAFTVQL